MRKIQAKVTFERDSTDLIAMVYQKDTVNVMFKIMFGEPVLTPIPSNGQYIISYSDRQIQFDAMKKKQRFIFSIDDVDSGEKSKNVYKKSVAGLSRMSPICFPRKPQDQ